MPLVAATQTPYEQHRDYVLTVLTRRCGWLDRSDREGIFHDAYALLLEKERDGELDVAKMHPNQVRAYLVQTSLYMARDEGRRAERKKAVPMGDEGLSTPDDDRPLEDALASNLDGARVREIVAELPERRQAIVKLRFFFDRTPKEIQDLLGLRERVYRRELERAMRQIAERYELVREGSFCESRRSMVMALVAGIAGPNRAREAQAHLDSCPACRAWAVQLREAARDVAGVLPAPAFATDRGGVSRVGEVLVSIRDQVVDLTGGVKQNATALATRIDASAAGYTSAARPGAVAMAVAGCVAIGGGVTYCAVEGLPGPLGSLVAPDKPTQTQKAERKARPTRSTPPVAQPTVTTATKRDPKPKPKPKAKAASTPAPDPTPVQQEFSVEGAGTQVPPSAAPAPPPPAPTIPPGPPGEFDP